MTSSSPNPDRSPRFTLGCAVWAFPGWVGTLYPKGARSERFLELYAGRFYAVEGNTTFYSVPSEAILRRWRAKTPPGFRFLLKLPRTITHEGTLVPRIEATRAFVWHVAALGDRLGPIFAQLPHTYGPELEGDLMRFLTAWPAGAPPLLVEVRHPRWFTDPERGRLSRHLADAGVGRVVLDSRAVYADATDPQAESQRRKPKLPVIAQATARTAMVRYIGHPDVERNAPYLEQWVERVQRWLDAGRDVHFFTHCPIEERSPAIARMFQAILESRGVQVPPLPWNELAEEQQLDLFGGDG